MSKLLYSNENPVNQNETTLSLENLLFAKVIVQYLLKLELMLDQVFNKP